MSARPCPACGQMGDPEHECPAMPAEYTQRFRSVLADALEALKTAQESAKLCGEEFKKVRVASTAAIEIIEKSGLLK